MGELIKKLLLMTATASFCVMAPHLFIVNTLARKMACGISGLNFISHLIHCVLSMVLKKRNFILGMIFYGICISCDLIDFVSNICFYADNSTDKSDAYATASKVILIQSSIIFALDGACILCEIIRRREQRIRDGLGSKTSSQKSQKHSPQKIADHGEGGRGGEGEGEGDLHEQTPKTKTPATDLKSDRKKKDDDSKKELKRSDRERSRKDHTDKDRRDREKSRSEKKDKDKTKSGRSEKKDEKSGKSSKENSEKSKEKSQRKKDSKGDDYRKKSEKEVRKKSSKKSEKSSH